MLCLVMETGFEMTTPVSTQLDVKRMINENYHFCILLLLTLSQLVMSLGAYAWGPLAPFLRADFGITRAQTGSIISVLYAVSIVVAMPSGLAVDKFGAKMMLVVALATMGFAFGALSLVDSFTMFVIFVGVSGIGYGMINQISSKGIIRWFQKKNRATAMGIKQAGVTLGGALGAVMLPAIVILASRRWATFAVAITMVITAFLVAFFYREHPAAAAIKDGASPVPAEKRATNRRKEFTLLLKKPELIVLCFVSMLLAASQTCIASFIVLYMQEELRATTAAAGMCLSIFMIAGTAGRVLWGMISDGIFKGDRQYPMLLLCLIAFGSALGMVFITSASMAWLPYFICAVMGFTFMGWNALFITFSAEIAGPALVGLVTGLTITVAWTGIIAGPPLFGLIADKVGYSWGWAMLAIFGLLCAISLLYSIRVTKNRNQGAEIAA